MSTQAAGSPQKLLMVRLGAIGDVIHALPALRALREAFPSARIHWAVETASAPILQGRTELDAVHVIPRKEWQAGALDPRKWPSIGLQATGVFREIRKLGFDAALDFQGNFRSGFVCWASGAAERIGFDSGTVKESSHLFYTRLVRPRSPCMHRVERNLQLLEALGVRTAVSAPWIGDHAYSPMVIPEKTGKPLAAFHAGVSAFGSLKAWPAGHFSEAAREFCKITGGGAVFTFGPGEEELARRMAEAAGPGAAVAPRTGSISDLVAFFRSVDAVCGVDTGPVQLAAAAGVPVVALFGPKDHRVYGPMGKVLIITSGSLGPACAPCGARRCRIPGPDGYSPCMSAIEPKRVANALAEAIRQSQEP